MPRRALVIVNPVAGRRGAVKDLSRLRERLTGAGVEFELLETAGAGDAFTWASGARDVDVVIALGGDGTIMETMSGLIEGRQGIPLAQIPTGTANLLARNLDIPTDLDEAIDVALEGICVRHDVGRVEGSGRYFAMVAGAGFDAQLMEDTPRPLKNLLGFGAYLLTGVRNLFRLRTSDVLVELDGKHQQFRAHTVLALNISGIQGLRFRGVSEIDPHDGKLDVAIVSPATFLGLIEVAWRLGRNRISGYDRLRFIQAEKVRIEAHPPLDVEIDGEPLGTTTPLSLEAVAGGALFIVPKSYAERRGLITGR